MQNHNPHAAHKNSRRDFLLLVSAPFVILLLVALFVYIPSALAKPSYDFIYQECSMYGGCGNTDLSVTSDGALKVTEKPSNATDTNSTDWGTVNIYYYDVSENTYKKITAEEAQKYKLDSSRKSPEGYTFAAIEDAGSFMFDGGEGGWYLKNGIKKKQLDIDLNSYDYEPSMFVGWVVPQ